MVYSDLGVRASVFSWGLSFGFGGSSSSFSKANREDGGREVPGFEFKLFEDFSPLCPRVSNKLPCESGVCFATVEPNCPTTGMSDSSGSWTSGCPEKYPWIEGDEPFDRWAAEWADFGVEQDDATSSRNPTLVNMEKVNLELIAINRGLTEDNQTLTQRNLELNEQNRDLANRNRDLTCRNLDLDERLYATEDSLTRCEDELTQETSMNAELTERVASLSTYICKLWIDLATSKGRERRAYTVILVMLVVLLFHL